MLTLIYFELRKLLQRRLVWAALLLFLLMNLLLLTTAVKEQYTYDPVSGQQAYNLAAIQLDKNIAARYGNRLTDTVVQQMLSDFQPTAEMLTRIGGVHVAYIRQNSMQAAVQYHFANADGSWNGQTVAQQFGAEPLTIGYVTGWLSFSHCLIKILLMLAILLLIILAPVFSGEYNGMDQLLLTTRYGRSKCNLAKIAAAFLLSLTLTAAVLLCNLFLARLVLGGDGLDCSILFSGVSFSEQSIPYNITCGAMLGYQILLAFTAVLMLTGIVLLLSALSQSPFVTLIVAAVLLVLPMLLPVQETSSLYPIIVLLPLYQLQFLSLMSLQQWSNGLLYATLAIPVAGCTAIVGTLWAHRQFSRHQVS